MRQLTHTIGANVKSTPNKRDPSFNKLYAKLPAIAQQVAKKSFKLFKANPYHPSLHLHDLRGRKNGRHREGSFSVSVSYRYRAIFVPVNGVNVWYWIGTHEAYNNFTGKK